MEALISFANSMGREKTKNERLSRADDDDRNKDANKTNKPLTDQELHLQSIQHASSAAQAQSKSANHDLEIAEKYMELGKALKGKGDFKGAIIEMHKALEIRRNVLGKEHPETASTYYQLGITHSQAKDYD